jgi:peptide/nickel transport system permease protein
MSEAGLDLAESEALAPVARRRGMLLRLLVRDKAAMTALAWLVLVLALIAAHYWLFGGVGEKVNLKLRNAAPFHPANGWMFFLGADALGRPMIARLAAAAGPSLGVAFAAVGSSLVAGTALGLVAGWVGGRVGTLILRVSDSIQGFPTFLLALIVLYIFGPSALNLVVVLGITRMPAYIRVARAEVLEIRERLFIDASRALGAKAGWILRTHVLPIVAPTVFTLASVNLAMVMLIESGLSFVGLGIQPPAVSWGLMVAQGRGYLANAWWLACFPGLAIMLTTVAFNVLSSWFRMATDPRQRWRLELK